MNHEQLLAFYTELSALIDDGKENEARELVGKRLAELPEDVQGEIVTRLYFQALEADTEKRKTIAEVQERGLAMVEALEIIQKKLQAESKA